MKFVVHHDGAERGPWTPEEISKKLNSKELLWTDYIYDENKKDWVTLLDHPHFANQFQSWSPPQEEKHEETIVNGSEWYILRDENRFGPFSYLEIIKMLQDKKLFEYDYVWNRPHMSTWERISEVGDFKAEKIKALKEKGGPDLGDVFFRRRHARAKYGASILLHDNKEVWRGDSMEISAGGAGLVMDSDQIQVGQSLFLHFKAGDGVPPFNAVCTIVSKQKQKNQYRYGVKFTSISQSVQVAIKKYTDRAA